MSITTPSPADLTNELYTVLRIMKTALNAPSNSEYDEGYDLATSRYVDMIERLLPPLERPTLADMTKEQQAEHIGVWCEYRRDGGAEPEAWVIPVETVNEAGRVPSVCPSAPSPNNWTLDPHMLTPRPDLPRAWNKDGTHPNPTPEPAQQERINPAECDRDTLYIVRVAGHQGPMLARRIDPADPSHPQDTMNPWKIEDHPAATWHADETVTVIRAISLYDD